MVVGGGACDLRRVSGAAVSAPKKGVSSASSKRPMWVMRFFGVVDGGVCRLMIVPVRRKLWDWWLKVWPPLPPDQKVEVPR